MSIHRYFRITHNKSTNSEEKLMLYKIFVRWGEAESTWFAGHHWAYYIYSE
jgi:hypothetical protein